MKLIIPDIGGRYAPHIMAALMLWGAGACARAEQVAGMVIQLNGAMTAQGSGRVKALALRSEVESGETLVTAPLTYAKVRFSDNSELTLKPGTTVRIDHFSFDGARPDRDKATYTLVTGGMRALTGLLGKRSKERLAFNTPSATIGIRGTTFILEYIGGPDAIAPSAGLPVGLHVYVKEGGISITNQAGVFQYDPGQFGYIKDDQTRPVKMTSNPGMQFDVPASFGEAGEVW